MSKWTLCERPDAGQRMLRHSLKALTRGINHDITALGPLAVITRPQCASCCRSAQLSCAMCDLLLDLSIFAACVTGV